VFLPALLNRGRLRRRVPLVLFDHAALCVSLPRCLVVAEDYSIKLSINIDSAKREP
jgi:hypothetical protein